MFGSSGCSIDVVVDDGLFEGTAVFCESFQLFFSGGLEVFGEDLEEGVDSSGFYDLGVGFVEHRWYE